MPDLRLEDGDAMTDKKVLTEDDQSFDPKGPGSMSAFPFQERDASGQPRTGGEWGLSKRELFAAMAIQNLCVWPIQRGDPELAATKAVEFADALLKELAK